MSKQNSEELLQLLGADQRDIGFLEYLPDEAVMPLTTAMREKLQAQHAALDKAIDEGVARLPAVLGGLAGSLLK